jgi:hypothetical protein
MPKLEVSEVTRIAREAASQQSLPVEVVGAVLGGADSQYVEILIALNGCAKEPCRFEIGVFRDIPEARLRDEIAARLQSHADEQRTNLLNDHTRSD